MTNIGKTGDETSGYLKCIKIPPKPHVAKAIVTLPRNMRNVDITVIAPVLPKFPHNNLNDEHAAVPKLSPQMAVQTNAFLLILSKQHCKHAKQQWIKQKTAF